MADALDYAALAAMSFADLGAMWRRLYRTEPPPGRAIEMLRYEIAWRDQAKRFGDLDKATVRVLRAQERARAEQGHAAATRAAPVGSTLVREWRGETYVVKVSKDGFVYDGRTYVSLSKIAREITGAARSGPLFFGLKS